MSTDALANALVVGGKYAVFEEFASGGMASVHFGFRVGENRSSQPLAVKALHPTLAKDVDVVAAFLDEARMSAHVQHPNVVQTIDVVEEEERFYVVMEYVDGASLAQLLRTVEDAGESVPLDVASAIFVGVLDGLHAAHETRDEQGRPMHIVHRDVSPQNFIVGVDGIARLLDFGIAKAEGRSHVTREGQLKGKMAYMAPERLRDEATRVSDVYSAGVCLWECLTARRLFEGDHPSVIAAKVSAGLVDPPTTYREMPPALEACVMKALAREPAERWQTADEMARALERAVPPASHATTGHWVDARLGHVLSARRDRLAVIAREGSDISLSLNPTLEMPRVVASARDRRVPLTLAAVAMAGAAVLLLYMHNTSKKAPIPAEIPPAMASVVPPAPPPTTDDSNHEEAIELGADPSDTPSPTTTPAHATRHHAGTRTSPASSSKNCNPPYEIDDQGMRHYKKECFPH